MDAGDERLDPLRSFAVRSLKVEQERWRQFVSEEEHQVMLSSFFNTPDYTHLFLSCDGGLSLSLDFPPGVHTKVLCVSKTGCDVITKENVRQILIIQEVQGGTAKSFIIAVSEVTCLLLSNPETSRSWAVGLAEEARRFMERQRNEAQVMKAQVEGRTFLPYPNALHDDSLQEDTEGRKLSDMKLLHACDSTIMEWAGLVSEFLQQDSSQPVLDGLEPLPSEEFNFWRTRLKNLHFIQQQCTDASAHASSTLNS